jgi:prephenate dehydrogenase
MIAAVSHIPHLLAAALVNHAVEFGDLELAAGGFRDTTRVASGSPELWAEILLANDEAVGSQVKQLISQLMLLAAALENTDRAAGKSVLLEMLKAAHDARSQFSAKHLQKP